jgi:hypothetical protein
MPLSNFVVVIMKQTDENTPALLRFVHTSNHVNRATTQCNFLVTITAYLERDIFNGTQNNFQLTKSDFS